MNRLVLNKWLEPFRLIPELGALDYEAAFTPRLPRRTALNRLNRLREAGWVDREGATRATIYHLTDEGRTKLKAEQAPQPSNTDSQARATMSKTSEDLRRKLHRPISERSAVGYQRSFLESYQPNKTHYLPEAARRKLLEIGSQTGMEAEPAGTYARHICQRLLIDLSWNSSRLEGNTYSLLETEQLFEAGRAGDAQLSNEAVMILNHKAAIEFLLESTTEADFDRRTILNVHALLTADPFRVRYRQAIAEQVAEIIRARCDRREAVARLRRWAEESVIENDRKRFVAAAEETLAGIHEGNFARYRIRPSEYESWKASWT